MTDAPAPDAPDAFDDVEHPDVVTGPDADGGSGERSPGGEAVTSPAKVMRIGSMVKALLEEVRTAPLDNPSRERLAEIYERSVTELSEALSDDLRDELRNLALPFNDGEVPSDSELRIAKAQLVGWLEGLFHGIQATLFAQQLAARQQLEQMRQLPGGAMVPGPGGGGPGGPGSPAGAPPGSMPNPAEERSGTYL
ncbi:hypothetical protein BH24ACT5_BH24ACT5_09280 [soil metagenome]